MKFGCDNLDYNFEYDSEAHAIVFSYFFQSGFFGLSGNLRTTLHGRNIQFTRGKKGRKKAIDKVYDDPAKMEEIAKKAVKIFSYKLGGEIENALIELSHKCLYVCGIEFEDSNAKMANLLSSWHRKELAAQLDVKPGKTRILSPKEEEQARREYKVSRTARIAASW